MKETKDLRQSAINTALRYLSTRPRSVYEVREKLASKGHGIAEIDASIEALSKTGYLDDRKFAGLLSSSRLRHKNWGLGKIRHELISKGIDKGIIEEVLGLGGQEAEAASAKEALRKWSKKNRLTAPFDRQTAGRAYRFLGSRGFSSNTALTAIKQMGKAADYDLAD